MAKVVIIGAGFAGHTAAIYLGKISLGTTMRLLWSTNSTIFSIFPLLISVGIGHMKPEKVESN